MSVAAVMWLATSTDALSHVQFRLGMAMANRANRDQRLNASIRRLAADAQMSVSTANLALRDLQLLGWVQKVHSGSHAPGDSNRYWLPVPEEILAQFGNRLQRDAATRDQAPKGVPTADTGCADIRHKETPELDLPNRDSVPTADTEPGSTLPGREYNTSTSLSPKLEKTATKAAIAKAAVDVWNEMAGKRLPGCRGLSPSRQAAVLARLDEHFDNNLEQWRSYLRRILRSPFLTGDNNREWRADFDFATNATSCLKILEGKYDRREPARPREEFFLNSAL